MKRRWQGHKKEDADGDENLENQIFPFAPISFFQLTVDCYQIPESSTKTMSEVPLQAKFMLPDTHQLCNQEQFAKVYMAWETRGLAFKIVSEHPFQKIAFPDLLQGDSVELFIDTRDVKTSGFNTRFCHHFYFLPEAFEGTQAGELTHFRTEDVHALCDPNELKVKFKGYSKGYEMQIFIPNSCLYGYDPDQFSRLGFTYRINRFNDEPQHFSVISAEYQLDQQPSLWSSIRLVK